MRPKKLVCAMFSARCAPIFLVLLLSICSSSVCALEPGKDAVSRCIKYLPLGDSYTIGESVATKDRWPDQLVQQLREQGVGLELVVNPARTGYTTEDLLTRETPVLEKEKPAFVTLLIGVNDYVRGVSALDFEKRFFRVLDRIQAVAPYARLLIVTIPDYGKTPGGASYGDPADTAAGITLFNKIIMAAARKRHIAVADIFAVSQASSAAGNVAGDGLHPSARQYLDWLSVIAPAAGKILKPAPEQALLTDCQEFLP